MINLLEPTVILLINYVKQFVRLYMLFQYLSMWVEKQQQDCRIMLHMY